MTEDLSRRKKQFIILGSVAAVLVVAVITGFVYVQDTPRYSLYRFKKAILNHDAEQALNYLDVDTIIDNMVKDSFGDPDKQNTGSGNKPDTSRKNVGREIIMQNLATIKTQLREQLKSAIVSYDDRSALETLSKASIFGLKITMEGDTALVKIRGKDKVAFKMARSQEGSWKIIAFNMKELVIPGASK